VTVWSVELVVPGAGRRASDEQHEEAREKLSNSAKPADTGAPSSIRE